VTSLQISDIDCCNWFLQFASIEGLFINTEGVQVSELIYASFTMSRSEKFAVPIGEFTNRASSMPLGRKYATHCSVLPSHPHAPFLL
jgi:hypothetical protein